MIDWKEVDLFKDCFTTLHEASKDGEHNAYMTDSRIRVVNVDGVKESYCKTLHLSEYVSSCDAFFPDGRGSYVLVEFKNGSLDSKLEIFDLKKKIYDSLLILSDNLDVHLTEMRESFVFILVYSEERNPNSVENNCLEVSSQTAVQDSASLTRIQTGVSDLAKQEVIKFKLSGFKKYCFREVHTYTKKEFEDFLQPKIGSAQMDAGR